MTCVNCSRILEKKLFDIPSVKEVKINYLTGRTVVVFDVSAYSEQQLHHVIIQQGYRIFDTKTNDLLEIVKLRNCFAWVLIFMVPLFYIAMAPMFNFPVFLLVSFDVFPINNIIVQVLLLSPILWITRDILMRGVRTLLSLLPTMESLIMLGVLSAVVYSIFGSFKIFFQKIEDGVHPQLYFETAGMLLTVILLGRLLEAHGKSKVRKAVYAMSEMASKTVIFLKKDGSEQEVDIETVVVGDCVIVRPGSKIPLDGEVIFGESDVDESKMTGESMLVHKKIGDKVIGTTINYQGLLHVKVLKIGTDTVFEQVVQMMNKAQTEKMPLVHITDRIARWFVPFIIGLAIFVFVFWILRGKDSSFALNIAITVLVISCPCALALATPLAAMVSISSAAQMGILFKNGLALQIMARVNKIFFDKTGTLTHNKMQVIAHYAHSKEQEDYYLGLLGSLEQQTTHPLGITLAAYLSKYKVYKHNDLENLPGYGIQAFVDDHYTMLGNKALIDKKNCVVPELFSQLIQDAKQDCHLVVYGVIDNRVEVVFFVDDVLKSESRTTIQTLQKLGVKLSILSGDTHERVKKVVQTLGLSEGYGGLLPNQKSEMILRDQKKGYYVAMVGDGVNDAVALTRADIGIAVVEGNDIAMESADIVFMKNDLNFVVKALTISKRAVTVIKQNLFWAFSYNIIALPLAAGIFYEFNGLLLTPVWAAIFMGSSSFLVIFNSLRVKNKEFFRKK